MEDTRLPKQVLYGELANGSRKRGGQTKRFKAQVKSDLGAVGICANEWTVIAENRSEWRTAVRKGVQLFEEALVERKRVAKEKRSKPPGGQVHEPAPQSAQPADSKTWPCDNCGRACKSQIGLFSHMRKCCRTNVC